MTTDAADRRHFVLAAEQWDEFITLLDREQRANPRLAKLMATPTVLDEEA